MLSYYISQIQSLLYAAPAVLAAIIFHECAHGWVSDRLGDPTPRRAGRLTLNPIRHLDPAGTLCLLFFHMGWAKPVPINARYYKNPRRGVILVSLAGPFANFILAFLSLLLYGLLALYAPSASAFWRTLEIIVYYGAVINVGLGVFNLIPFPPLDGSHVLEELIPAVGVFFSRFQSYGRLLLLLLLASGALSRPLSWLDNAVLNGLWGIVYQILIRLPVMASESAVV
ncbi:MAG: site-2 protease family protein [Lachnospiraceae bacterium]|nr:site-2 protease family protein [Lachnospiraceae bacterium]